MPSLPYTATISISPKGRPFAIYLQMELYHKGPDGFVMTKRSDQVTDFVRMAAV
jgi:hypothetical protein